MTDQPNQPSSSDPTSPSDSWSAPEPSSTPDAPAPEAAPAPEQAPGAPSFEKPAAPEAAPGYGAAPTYEAPATPPPSPPGAMPPPADGGYGQPAGGYAPAPQGQAYAPTAPNPMSPSDEKMWATLTHLSPIVLSFVGPLIAYLVLKDRGPFIRHHAAQALNFQIIIAIAMVVGAILTVIIIGAFLMLAAGIAGLVFAIIAAIAANRGEWYRYPMTPDWIK